MKPHQKQLLAERKQLKQRLDGLRSFVAESSVFKTLGAVEQEQIHAQASVMQTYDDILCRRIAAFDNPTVSAADYVAALKWAQENLGKRTRPDPVDKVLEGAIQRRCPVCDDKRQIENARGTFDECPSCFQPNDRV